MSLMNEFYETNKDVLKPADIHGPFLKKLSGFWAVPIARFIDKHTTIKPNHVTALVFVIAAVCAYMFYTGNYFLMVAGSILYLFDRFVVDRVDGLLARVKKTSSPYGSWLDHGLDMFGWVFVYLGITWGTYNKTGDYYAWLFGFLAMTALFMRVYLYNLFRRNFSFATEVIEHEKGKMRFLRNFFYEAQFITIGILVAAALDQFYYMLVVFSIVGWGYSVAMFYVFSKRIKANLKIQRTP